MSNLGFWFLLYCALHPQNYVDVVYVLILAEDNSTKGRPRGGVNNSAAKRAKNEKPTTQSSKFDDAELTSGTSTWWTLALKIKEMGSCFIFPSQLIFELWCRTTCHMRCPSCFRFRLLRGRGRQQDRVRSRLAVPRVRRLLHLREAPREALLRQPRVQVQVLRTGTDMTLTP